MSRRQVERIFSFVALLILAVALPASTSTPRAFIATVQRVSDGDTIAALTSNATKLHTHLLGIDAPEIAHGKTPGQAYGGEARDYLDHLIAGKTVRVDAYGSDQYHRVLAVIWSEDEQVNVNLLMVAMGYAEVYRGARCQVYCRELENAEAKARRDHVGTWSQESCMVVTAERGAGTR